MALWLCTKATPACFPRLIPYFACVKLLLIEDERDLRESIVRYLQGEQYRCETATDFSTALEKTTLFSYDCILLDINLPDGSGLELLRTLKEDQKQDGVIIISARNSTEDKIAGLNLGADDYLSKPFHLAELEARIAAVIRRKYFQGNNLLVLGEMKIDLGAKTVTANHKLLELTPTEFDLLLFLASNKNKIVSKNAIAIHILGDEAEWLMQYDIVYAHVKNLKKKLADGGCRDYIQSRYGMGYKLQIT